MNKILKSLIVLMLLVGLIDNPVIAQSNSNQTESRTNEVSREDNTGKWGLLGLLGLLGFISTKRPEKTSNYTTTNTPQNR